MRGAVPGLADQESLVEWFQEQITCPHDSRHGELGACAFCMAARLLDSDWLATYVRQQARYDTSALDGGAL